ncbi:hydantoinase B/oxoprolinase family protein [Candidatus Entotheonella palauensis]|nr:hydantoinase B/oxoprolinase family protein [Candidatus Entotheonella palauensis]
MTLDPITLEIIHNALRSVTDETFIALMKSAYSTNIKERRDHSTGFIDVQGRLVVMSDASLPVHLGSLLGVTATLLGKYPLHELYDGDIFVANDPHTAGGTHLPDVTMVMPVFAHGHLLGFAGNIAHHADIGGMTPGSLAGGMTEIYQEGLRIPLVKLFRQGELQQDLLDLLLLNVRVPDERRGDYFAQVAACRLGARRMVEIADMYRVDMLEAAFEAIIDRTQQRMRDAVNAIPDGIYTFEDQLDDDGQGTYDIPIRVRIDVQGDRIRLDFSGTSPQVPGNLNTGLNATQSAACYAIKALLDPEIPNNQGVLNVIEVFVPEGSLINCRFPGAVAQRATTCQRIVDVVLGALTSALPEASVGAANGANTTAVFSGVDPKTQQSYVYLETLGGGFGGRATKDGKDAVQVHITNTSNLPVEAIEMEYPLLVEGYGVVEDSGGAGTFRGGAGLRRVVRPMGHACTFNGAGERFRHQPWGIFGGEPGRTGRYLLSDEAGREQRLDDKPMGVAVTPEQMVVIETPGSGGYGPAAKRCPDLIREDLQSGKFTPAFIERHYGVQLTD